MKGIRRSVLLAVALVALASTSARANTITPTNGVFAPGVSMSYTTFMTSGELHTGDGFTIFDFGGFLGVLAMPVDWTASTSLVGSPFGTPLGTDHTAVRNVHFTYGGLSVEVPGLMIFAPFTVRTSSMATVSDDWVSRDHLLATPGTIDGGPSVAKGNILVPVPDGGSTAALLGSVLFSFGMLRRKFSKS